MSYINLSSEKVIRACNLVIGHAEWLQAHYEMAAIQKYSKAKMFWLFGKEKGYDKAFYDIKNAGSVFDYMEYTAVFFTCSEKYEKAQKLKLLAEHGNPVKVSLEDAFILDSKYEQDLIKWGVI